MQQFLDDLARIAPAVGQGCYSFNDGQGGSRGWAQFILRSPTRLELHRLWTLAPGKGNGAAMLQALCDLADRHGIEIVLKPLPFGRKPYPLSREQLQTWYATFGFTGDRKRMLRPPRPAAGPSQT